MINDDAFDTAFGPYHLVFHEKMVREFLDSYLSCLPKPEMPFDQARLYRKMTRMEQ